jgi:hypothetical protein
VYEVPMAAYSRNTKLLAHGTHPESQLSSIVDYDEIDTKMLNTLGVYFSFLFVACSVTALCPILKA